MLQIWNQPRSPGLFPGLGKDPVNEVDLKWVTKLNLSYNLSVTEQFRDRYAKDEIIIKHCVILKWGSVEKLINPNV